MDINNCTNSNTASGQESAIISHNSNLPKRFELLINNLESVNNRTDKAGIKDFIHFSKYNLEKINSSLMSVSNPQEVLELIQQASRPCLIIKDEIELGGGSMSYILQEEGKLEDSLKSLKDRLQIDIGIQTPEEAPLSTEEKVIREALRIGKQIEEKIPETTKRIEEETKRSLNKVEKETNRLGKRIGKHFR